MSLTINSFSWAKNTGCLSNQLLCPITKCNMALGEIEGSDVCFSLDITITDNSKEGILFSWLHDGTPESTLACFGWGTGRYSDAGVITPYKFSAGKYSNLKAEISTSPTCMSMR